MTNEHTVTHLSPEMMKDWDEEEGDRLVE